MAKLSLLVPSIFTLLFCGVAFAQDYEALIDRILECSELYGTITRTECYDAIAEELGTDGPAQPPPINTDRPNTGSWRIRRDTSAIDDSPSVYLSVEAADVIPDRLGIGTVQPILFIRCVENTTAVVVSVQRYLGLRTTRVRYRIDDQTAQSASWQISNDTEAIGLWNGATSIPFIQQLFGANVVLFEITPYNDNTVTFRFPISALEEAISPLRAACHW